MPTLFVAVIVADFDTINLPASPCQSAKQHSLQITPAVQHCHDQDLPIINPVNDAPGRADQLPVLRDAGMQQLRHDTSAIKQGNQESGFGFQPLQDRQRITNTVLCDVLDDLC